MTYARPIPSQIPQKEYDWAFTHHQELVRKFPNQWIAFLHGKVLAHGRDPIGVLKKARKSARKDQEIPTLFIEKGIHIYSA
jgi:hypothetical protein